jgi:hypothetical protein
LISNSSRAIAAEKRANKNISAFGRNLFIVIGLGLVVSELNKNN